MAKVEIQSSQKRTSLITHSPKFFVLSTCSPSLLLLSPWPWVLLCLAAVTLAQFNAVHIAFAANADVLTLVLTSRQLCQVRYSCSIYPPCLLGCYCSCWHYIGKIEIGKFVRIGTYMHQEKYLEPRAS